MDKALICLIITLLLTSTFSAGYFIGDRRVRIAVFKNCMGAMMNPGLCTQYMRIIKDGK